MNKADLNTEKIVLTPDKHDTQLTVIYSVISAIMYIIGFVSFFISKDIFALEAMIFVGTIILVFILFFQYPYFHRTIIMDEKI